MAKIETPFLHEALAQEADACKQFESAGKQLSRGDKGLDYGYFDNTYNNLKRCRATVDRAVRAQYPDRKRFNINWLIVGLSLMALGAVMRLIATLGVVG